MTTRVIALIDMDCFYCQVEEKLNPNLQGKPVAVVQYNLWREGGIIAVNYLAKEKGVTKGMWKHEAKDLCPEIEFARVAEVRGRADLTKYRDAGNQVVKVLSTFTGLLERASIDEAYLDLTEGVNQELMKGISNIPLEKLKTTHIVGIDTADFILNISSNRDTDGFYEDDLKLAIGGIIVERIRASIFEKTGYRCSAGIAHNKILAKLVCGLHKPNKQTILPGSAIPQFFSELPLRKIKRLGGKFGKRVLEELNIMNVGELLQFSEKELIKRFDLKTGQWLYNIAKGIDNEPVSPKILSKSLSCCKRFPGKNALFRQKDVEHWIKELAIEVAERLAKDRENNNRKAKMITVSFVQEIDKKDVNTSKTFALRSYEADIIAKDALVVIRKCCRKSNSKYYLKYLGISVGSFEELKNIKDIKFFFAKTESNEEKSSSDKIKLEKSDEKELEENEHNRSLNLDDYQGVIDSSLLTCGETGEKSNTSEDAIFTKDKIIKIECNDEHSSPEQDTGEAHCSTHSEIPVVNGGDVKYSFFNRYFKNVTSKVIGNPADAASASETGKNEQISENSENNDNAEIIFQKCDECGLEIRKEEFGVHTDYHFALKLQKQDISTGGASDTTAKNTNQSFKKRKAHTFGNAPIDFFLTTVASHNEEATEVCETCNKKIRISELLSHFDYHAAKNLHKMLNSQSKSCDDNSNRRKTETLAGDGILRYLKRKSS